MLTSGIEKRTTFSWRTVIGGIGRNGSAILRSPWNAGSFTTVGCKGDVRKTWLLKIQNVNRPWTETSWPPSTALARTWQSVIVRTCTVPRWGEARIEIAIKCSLFPSSSFNKIFSFKTLRSSFIDILCTHTRTHTYIYIRPNQSTTTTTRALVDSRLNYIELLIEFVARLINDSNTHTRAFYIFIYKLVAKTRFNDKLVRWKRIRVHPPV